MVSAWTGGDAAAGGARAAAGWVIWPGQYRGFVALPVNLDTIADALAVARDRRDQQRLLAALTAGLPARQPGADAGAPVRRA